MRFLLKLLSFLFFFRISKLFTFFKISSFLLVFSFVFIFFPIWKDNQVKPEDRLEQGIHAYSNNQFQQAIMNFKKVIRQKKNGLSAQAYYYLGHVYLKTKQNKLAKVAFEQAVALSNPKAMLKLAYMYDIGDVIPENKLKALVLMKKASQANIPEASYALGVWKERGYIKEKVIPQEIITLYEKAAAQNYIPAVTSLIAIYSGNSQYPELKNDKKAQQMIQKLNALKSAVK